jgi:hypothetical protein
VNEIMPVLDKVAFDLERIAARVNRDEPMLAGHCGTIMRFLTPRLHFPPHVG